MGYQKPGTIPGVQMVIPTFTDVAKGDKVMLSKIEVTGYEDVYDGFEGIVMMTKVDDAGFSRNDSSFENPIQWDYVAYIDETGWQKFWVDSLGTGEPVTADNDIEIEYGEGLYLNVGDVEEGADVKLTYSGAVAPNDNQYDLIPGINIVGNPMPTTVGVGSIDITGYEEAYEAFEGYVMMTKVDDAGFSRNDGSFENPIQWDYVAYIDETGWQKFWVDSLGSGEPIVPGAEAGEQIVQPGEGLYINNGEEEVAISVIFPSPIAKHDAE